MTLHTPLPLCSDCLHLGLKTFTTTPHAALCDLGYRKPKSGEGAGRQYQCNQCDSIWLQYTDKWGANSTFHLVPEIINETATSGQT